MSTTQQRATIKELQQDEREMRGILVGEQVLHALGEPGDLLRVQVREVWANRYRVNIFTGKEIASAHVAHSYFLVADGDGNIVESSPAIAKQY